MITFRLVVLIFSCLGLSGCASLQLMSWGASGLSYLVTGKSISDHAISTVMKKDCALHRGIVGNQTCIEYDGDGVIRGSKPGGQPVVAKEDNWQIAPNDKQNEIVIAQSRQLPPINHPKLVKTAVSPDKTVLELMEKQEALQKNSTAKIVTTHAATELSAPVNSDDITISSRFNEKTALYAVVGSYNNKHFALNNIAKQQRKARQNKQTKKKSTAKLMVNSIDLIRQGATKYRVVIGPISPEQFSVSIGDVGENPNHKAWRMTLCQQSLSPPPCDANLFAANR